MKKLKMNDTVAAKTFSRSSCKTEKFEYLTGE